MTATAAEALELALWLHRAPARRAALLGRPLPEGIGQLLRVAGGSPDQVAAAAMITGESEATVLEAVRFYLQQILFHEDADAYRVLGLRPDASHAQAREHHRLLQHWLHPDRRGADEWESVYAARVNRAWARLRTPQARAAYDATLPPLPQGGSQYGLDYQLPVASHVGGRHASRSRTLTFVVLLGCVGLLVIIALRNEQPPQWRVDTAGAPPAEPETAIANRGGSSATLAESVVAAADEPPPLAATARRPRPTRPARVQAVSEPATAALDMLVPPAVAAALFPGPPDVRVDSRAKVEPTLGDVVANPAGSATAGGPVVLEVKPPAAPDRAPRKPEPAPPEPMPAIVGVPDPMASMAQLRDMAHQLSAYLSDPVGATPPVWNDLTALRQAQGMRAGLHQRLGMPRRLVVQLADPQWRLGAEDAHVVANYDARGEQGRLEVVFTWRENQWLVREITLVPVP